MDRTGVEMTYKVLMIEDDAGLAGMIVDYMKDHGIDVLAAHDAASGLDLLQRDSFDAVILDLMLPDMDGLEVCRTIRTDNEIPILMLTARGDEEDRIVGLELGADDYLPKPFNPRELLARMKAILRRGKGAARESSGSLRFGRLQIDPERRTVTVSGKKCDLTGYQFDLLHILARNAGRVMSRDRLMELLRGETPGAFDRSIDVHVSRIRGAIESDPQNPRRLLTVRGVGYVLAARQDDD